MNRATYDRWAATPLVGYGIIPALDELRQRAWDKLLPRSGFPGAYRLVLITVYADGYVTITPGEQHPEPFETLAAGFGLAFHAGHVVTTAEITGPEQAILPDEVAGFLAALRPHYTHCWWSWSALDADGRYRADLTERYWQAWAAQVCDDLAAEPGLTGLCTDLGWQDPCQACRCAGYAACDFQAAGIPYTLALYPDAALLYANAGDPTGQLEPLHTWAPGPYLEAFAQGKPAPKLLATLRSYLAEIPGMS
jgi:hypothetical protein